MSDSVQILNPGSSHVMSTALSRRRYVQLRHQINWSAVIALAANLGAWVLLVAALFAVFD